MKLLLLSAVAFLCLQLTIAAPTEGESEQNETESIEMTENETNYTGATEKDVYVYNFISTCDIDYDGQISIIELEQTEARAEEMSNALRKQFNKMDKNGNGIIEPEEFYQAKELEHSLLAAIISNCDTDYDGKISINDLENAIIRNKALKKKVDNRMVANKDLNETEFYTMMAIFTDGKEQTVLEFAASTSRDGDYAADFSISKNDTLKAIQKVIDILETLHTNFAEVDTNKNGAIERIEIMRKLVEMNEAVDTGFLSAIICYCDGKKEKKVSQDQLENGITKFNDIVKNLEVNFEKIDKNGDGKLNKGEIGIIVLEWVGSSENEKN